MALDLDAGAWIRAGSGIVWLALGATMLVLARDRPGRFMAVAVAAVGGHFALFNVTLADPSTQILAVTLSPALYALAGIAAVALAWQLAPTATARRVVAAFVAFAALASFGHGAYSIANDVPVAAAIVDPASRSVYRWSVSLFVLAQTSLVALPAALAWRAREGPGAPLVAIAVALYAAFHGADGVAQVLEHSDARVVAFLIYYGSFLLAVLAACATWLLVAQGEASRSARNVALVLTATALAGALSGSVEANEAARAGVGILRTIAGAMLALAVFRHGFLDLPLPRLVATRGSLAAAALASLFIVAQVAQNFLSAEYGLVMGGVVAGAFLFAASPIQRAIEGVRGPGPAPGRAPGDGPGPHDEAYRNAVRVALRDRRLTRDEEVALADVAERLGIGARRAAEIRHDVERERGLGG